MVKLNLSLHKGNIEFVDKNDKIRVGNCFKIEVECMQVLMTDVYQTSIIYHIHHNKEDRDLIVDGDTFREI